MTPTITTLLPKITSLQSQISSIDAVMATATVSAEIAKYSKLEQKLSYSLEILVNQQFMATATSQIAAASSSAAAASSALSVIIDNGNYYGMFPSFVGNTIMAAAMGLFFVIHTSLGIWYRTWGFGVSFFLGCGLEFIGYIGRSLSAHDADNLNYYMVQSIPLTIAPCFIMAGVYVLLGQLIVVFGAEHAILKPRTYSYIFITCDVLALFIQGGGGGVAATASNGTSSNNLGTTIMIAGLIFQVVSMGVFIILFAHFLHKIRYFKKDMYQNMEDTEQFDPQYKSIRTGRLFRVFVLAIAVAVLFVFIRCIYRVIELANGWRGYLVAHEIYFMILEGAMMGLAILVFIIFHPGFVLGSGVKVKNEKSNKQFDDNVEEFRLLKSDSYSNKRNIL